MYCSKCGTDNKQDSKFCAGCGALLTSEAPERKFNNPNPSLGMATIRIIAKPQTAVRFWTRFPLSLFKSNYKFYYNIDGNEYTMYSKEKVKEVRIPAGEHLIRIGYEISDKASNATAIAGKAIELIGGSVGSADMAMVGRAASLNEVTADDYCRIEFISGKVYECVLQLGWFGIKMLDARMI